VYPAGFVYVYAALKRVTGGAVALAQPLFAALYVATLAVVLTVYVHSRVLPPAALPLLCLSKRLHSIYLLRLFNDGVAMLPALAAVALSQRGRWCGCACPCSALALTPQQAARRPGLERSPFREDERAAAGAPAGSADAARGHHPLHCGLCIARSRAAGAQMQRRHRIVIALTPAVVRVQAVLGAPFLAHAPWAYLGRAFDFGRRFEQRWSVNLQFLPEHAFLSRTTAAALLVTHLALLAGAWVAPDPLARPLLSDAESPTLSLCALALAVPRGRPARVDARCGWAAARPRANPALAHG